MLLFFFIPVRLRARTLLIASAFIAIAGIAWQFIAVAWQLQPSNLANAAHLGGMALGWFYVKFILKNPALIGAHDQADEPPPKKSKIAADEISESDVDAILDKISAHGIQSLTARERAVLEAARRKMAQR